MCPRRTTRTASSSDRYQHDTDVLVHINDEQKVVLQTAVLADAKGECLLFALERNSAPTQFVVENFITDLQNVLCDRLGLDVGFKACDPQLACDSATSSSR